MDVDLWKDLTKEQKLGILMGMNLNENWGHGLECTVLCMSMGR
jgi:hypothetical protein